MLCQRSPNGGVGAPAGTYLGAAGGDALTLKYRQPSEVIICKDIITVDNFK
jgi:hypothetical protein